MRVWIFHLRLIISITVLSIPAPAGYSLNYLSSDRSKLRIERNYRCTGSKPLSMPPKKSTGNVKNRTKTDYVSLHGLGHYFEGCYPELVHTISKVEDRKAQKSTAVIHIPHQHGSESIQLSFHKQEHLVEEITNGIRLPIHPHVTEQSGVHAALEPLSTGEDTEETGMEASDFGSHC